MVFIKTYYRVHYPHYPHFKTLDTIYQLIRSNVKCKKSAQSEIYIPK